MSIFSGIEKAAHTFAAWAEKELTVLEGKAPTIERVIDTTLSYVGPALELGLDALNQPAIAAEVATVVAKAQSDLKAASALVTDFGPTPTAASAFTAVQTNLSSLLTAGQITNPTTVATITKSVAEVGAVAAAVQVAATAIAASVAPPTAEPAA